VQNLRDTIVCEHGDFVNVVKVAVRLIVESSPQIGYEDLCSLEETNTPTLKSLLVTKAWEVLCKEIDESCCGVIGRLNKFGDAAIKILRWYKIS
jgi:hypothetical protein